MYKFQIASDLHIDDMKSDDIKSLLEIKEADCLIVAGDLCRSTSMDKAKEFFDHYSRKFLLIFYVLGNHEYYYKRGQNVVKHSPDVVEQKFRCLLKAYNNVHLMINKAVLFPKYKICVSGATYFPRTNPNQFAAKKIPDWVRLHVNNKQMYMIKQHRTSRNFTKSLSKTLDSKYKDYKWINITHYSPLPINNDEKNQDKRKEFESLYYLNLKFDDVLPGKKPSHWIYGHTHKNTETQTKGISFTSNQYTDNIEKGVVEGSNAYNRYKIIDLS